VKFKTILAWIKANLFIVIFSALILIMLPTAFFVSSAWMKKILDTQTKAANDKLKEVQSAKVTYEVPQLDPTIEKVTTPGVPNLAMIEHFKQAREAGVAAVAKVAKQGEDFNKGVGSEAQSVGRSEFKPLVEGIFPKVVLTSEQASNPALAQDAEQNKLSDMQDALLGRRGKTNPYEALLASVRAGTPADPKRLVETLKDLSQRETERRTAGARAITEAERSEVLQLMKDRRLAEYQTRARSIGIYASLESLPHQTDPNAGGRGVGEEGVPKYLYVPVGSVPQEYHDRGHMFLYQWDLWVMQDVLTAIRLANTAPNGEPATVERAVVKRIKSMEIPTPAGLKSLTPKEPVEGEAPPPDVAAGATPTATVAGMVPMDVAASITGRGRGSWNTFYEMRSVKLVLVVDSSRIQDLITAINRTNFMSVADLDLRSIDIAEDLRAGYYYGEDHVVQATLKLDTVWLKSWLVPMMPEELMKALDIPVPVSTAGADAGSAPANPG
jgi:hypothetical protein